MNRRCIGWAVVPCCHAVLGVLRRYADQSCSLCVRARSKAHYEANKEAILAGQKTQRAAQPEQERAKAKEKRKTAAYKKTMRVWREKNKTKLLEYNRADSQKRAGIVYAEGQTRETLLQAQNYVCPVCGESLRNTPIRHTAVDHCHKTSNGPNVRGVLHGWCNRGIGSLRDSPDFCTRAARYLRGFESINTYDGDGFWDVA